MSPAGRLSCIKVCICKTAVSLQQHEAVAFRQVIAYMVYHVCPDKSDDSGEDVMEEASTRAARACSKCWCSVCALVSRANPSASFPLFFAIDPWARKIQLVRVPRCMLQSKVCSGCVGEPLGSKSLRREVCGEHRDSDRAGLALQ